MSAPLPQAANKAGDELPGSKEVPSNEVSSDDASSIEDIDGDYGSYSNHIFSDPKIAEYWRNVYEKATYEGRHRFDPAFTWSATEEKRLRRKVSFETPIEIPWTPLEMTLIC